MDGEAGKKGGRWNSTKDTAMILYALCAYYDKVGKPEQAAGSLRVVFNDGDPIEAATNGVESTKLSLPAESLQYGRNTLLFEKAPAGALFRLTLRCTKTGKTLDPVDQGLQVSRHFFLFDPYTGNQVRQLADGDTVPPGSYVSAQVRVASQESRLPYLLVRCPKPSGCQTVPLGDRRFSKWATRHAQLREDKSDRILWHYEDSGRSLWSQALFFCELEGDFVVPPASAELMYSPETLGSSAAMTLSVRAPK
jgi:uncharacterized protein YfaS (alpha-2-macroglobulin family)